MAKSTSTLIASTADPRLEAIRGTAPRRSPTVRALAAYAGHSDCSLATLGFAAGVDFDRLLRGTPYQPTSGQSPFAFARGQQFEERLREKDYALLLGLLEARAGAPLARERIVNLRARESMAERSRKTLDLLGQIVRREPAAPHLIDGAVLRGWIGGVLAYFEADAVAACLGDQLQVAEVKSFPKVDERIDPDKLGAALDQVAIYILLARQEIDRQHGSGVQLVSERALLITPRNVGLTPVLSEQPVVQRIARIEALLAAVPRAADVAAAVPAGLSLGPIGDEKHPVQRRLALLHDLADRVGTAYKPTCLTTCGNAFFCRERAFRTGAPCVVGTGAVRLLPGVDSLARAAQLSHGEAPTAVERPAADLLAGAGAIYDAVTAPTTPVEPDTARRRPA
jgi:hypothetical protein